MLYEGYGLISIKIASCEAKTKLSEIDIDNVGPDYTFSKTVHAQDVIEVSELVKPNCNIAKNYCMVNIANLNYVAVGKYEKCCEQWLESQKDMINPITG